MREIVTAVPDGEEHFRISTGADGPRVFLRHRREAGTPADSRSVLFIHGATFPSALAAAFRFDGRSWMDDLCDAGFDAWALDFAGYGESDRYPEMPSGSHEDGSPPGRAAACCEQIKAAIHFIRERRGLMKVSIIAHSWGTMAAGLHATKDPGSVESLVMFGPVASRGMSAADESGFSAYTFVTAEYQWNRFSTYVPKGESPQIDKRHFASWAAAYLASDPTSSERIPPSVKVPNGPTVDIDAAWHGNFIYEPSRIVSPVLIVRGEWDSVTTDGDAQWLVESLRSAPTKQDVVIPRGTHLLHLEHNRALLYRAVRSFLQEQT